MGQVIAQVTPTCVGSYLGGPEIRHPRLRREAVVAVKAAFLLPIYPERVPSLGAVAFAVVVVVDATQSVAFPESHIPACLYRRSGRSKIRLQLKLPTTTFA